MKLTKENLLQVDQIDYQQVDGLLKSSYHGKFVADKTSLVYVEKSGKCYWYIAGAINVDGIEVTIDFLLDKLLEKEDVKENPEKSSLLNFIGSSEPCVKKSNISDILQLKVAGFDTDEIIKLQKEGLL